MGFFDFLSTEKRRQSRLERDIRSANNKFKPKDYRQISLQNVIQAARNGDQTAIAGLLKRFTVVAEPSMEDEKEKEWVFDALVEIGRDALPEIRRSMRSLESLTWIHRTLKSIVADDEYKEELLEIISDFDTEYEKNPDRKLQTIMALADINDAKVAEALVRFLEDVDETVRYQTAIALTRQEQDLVREPLLKTMCEDESIRVRNEVVEAFSRLEWQTTGYRKKVDAILPKGFKQEKSGKIVKLGG
jgi:hypothetical protein